MDDQRSPVARILAATRWILSLPIRIYQKIISPLIPSRCIYTPTCSKYSRRAVMRHGLLGFLLGAARLLRCVGGLYTGGEDEVPERFSFSYLFGSYRKYWRGRSE